MSRIPNVGGAPSTTGNTSTQSNQFSDLDVQDFLDLMITELSNQDPLNPMDNEDLVAQINQIREIGATDKLTETLEAVLTGSNLTAASSMIGTRAQLLERLGERVDVVGISRQGAHAHDEPLAVGRGDQDLAAELVALARLAFRDAVDLGLVQGVELAFVLRLLAQQPIDQGDLALDPLAQGRIGHRLQLPLDVAQ